MGDVTLKPSSVTADYGVAIKYARMHTTLFVPELAQLGPELTDVQTGSSRAVEMFLNNGLVTCTTKGKGGKLVSFLVPASNFQVLVAKT
jgi:hypothetical protein